MSTTRNDPAREARLKAALKANIARRKQQARARADDGASDDPEAGTGARDAPGNSAGPKDPSSRKDRT